MDVLTLMLISLPAGLLGAILGIGGGIIIVPLLTLFGVPIKYAIAASVVTVIATSSTAASSYLRNRLANVRVTSFFEAFMILGAIVGALIMVRTPPKLLYFIFAFIVVLAIVGLKRRLKEELPAVKVQDSFSKRLRMEGTYYDEALKRTVEYKVTNSLRGALLVFFSGLASALIGVGGGVFNVPIFQLVLRMPAKASTATSAVIIGTNALASATIYLMSGLVYADLVAPLIVGVTLGSLIGTRILRKISNRLVKLMFIVVLSYVVIQMLYKGVT